MRAVPGLWVVLLVLAACGPAAQAPLAGDPPALSPAPATIRPVPRPDGAAPPQTAETLDAAGTAETAAALAPPAGGRLLGEVSVSLGSPAEQGFWLRGAIVAAPGQGKVELPGGGSVAVELIPGEGAAQLSLSAYRALGLLLTDLPLVRVYAD